MKYTDDGDDDDDDYSAYDNLDDDDIYLVTNFLSGLKPSMRFCLCTG